MLACVYQQSDSRLYKGGVVTPLVHLGGQRHPRRPPGSVKPKPPKPAPKPQSISTSSSDKDPKSSPSHKSSIEVEAVVTKSPKCNNPILTQTKNQNNSIQGSSENNSDKENTQENLIVIKKVDNKVNSKDKRDSKGNSINLLREQEFRIGKKPRDIPIPHKIIRSITSSIDNKSVTSNSDASNSPENNPRNHYGNKINGSDIRISNGMINMPKGNQEKLLKTKNDPDKRQSQQRNRPKLDRVEVSTLQETNDVMCNGIVTITDNNGRIYCIDNMVLLGEDVFGKIKSDDLTNDPYKLQGSSSKCISKLTVKNKTDGGSFNPPTDGTKSLELPEGVELTLGELRAMALRQQQQIDCQHQLLAAREQRLRFLKQQEAKQHQVAAENERLRRLRERVEAQELKLRRLRALRGQLDQTNINNVALTSDLESIRALFNEKEKELSVAVAKVEELTRQLEEVRRGRAAPPRPQPPAAQELDKLRRELMYRNKLNEQQNARLSQQREALTARQAEMASIDQRISELQVRLQRKRVANRQLASQISGKHAARSNNTAGLAVTGYPISGQQSNPLSKGQTPRGNIAAVEPYNHIPHPQSVSHNFQALKHNAIQNNAPIKLLNQNDATTNHIINQQQESLYLQQQKQFTNQNIFSNNGSYPQRLQANLIQTDTHFTTSSYPKQVDIGNTYQQQGITNQMIVQNDQKFLMEHINKYNNIDLQKQQTVSSVNNTAAGKQQQRTNNVNNNKEQEFLPEFTASKSDPKYQTLPYNTKFSTTSSNNTNPSSGSNNVKANKVQFYDDNNTGKQSSEMSSTTTGIVKTSSSSNVNSILSSVNSNSNSNHMTAHSTPLTTINNKGHATTPHLLNDGENNMGGYHVQKSESSSKCNQEEKENLHSNGRDNQQPKVVGEQFKVAGFTGGRAELVRGFSQHTTVTSTSSGQIMKPVSSVAPTTVQVASGKPSPIYQTSSTKIQPVQPQTVSNSLSNNGTSNSANLQHNIHSFQSQIPTSIGNQGLNKQVPLQNASVSSLIMSPPQNSSTPVSTPDVSSDKAVPKPALPPKPAPKVPTGDLSQSSDSKTSENTSSIPSSESQSEQDISGQNTPQSNNTTTSSADGQQMIIKARPLTIRKQPLSEQPKLKSLSNNALKNNSVNIATTRRIEMPSAFLFADMEHQQQRESSPQSDKVIDNKNTGNKQLQHSGSNSCLNSDVVDRAILSSESSETSSEDPSDKNLADQMNTVDLNNSNGDIVSRRVKKGNLKQGGKVNLSRRVSFDPLALLLDASLEGELELVKKTATQVANPSAANDEGITALHNAICAGHFEIVKFLVEFGCDVNAQDSDGWTPLHCAASCNNVSMVRFLVENGACIFATTLSDHETAAQKCEEDEEGFDGCSEYLYSVQEKLGIMNVGTVYAVFPYTAHESDELSFIAGSRLTVLRKGDEAEREWWWVRDQHGREGYVPRNLLGLYPRVTPKHEHLQ